MLRSGRIALCTFLLASTLLRTPLFAADKPKAVPTAPVPAQILSGRTAFISYTGIDPNLRTEVAKFTGSPNGYYDQFYDAMKTWGHYDLLPAPADADLVLEISVNWAVPVTVPHLQLRIIDPKTHIVLWGFSEATERNAKDWDKSLAALVNDVKAIAAQPPDSTNK